MILHEFLQTLSHLKLILIWEIFHQAVDLQSLSRTLSQKFESDDLKSVLHRGGNFTRMWAGDFGDGERLSNDEE